MIDENEARIKRELINILQTEPRARWVDIIMERYGCAPAHRVDVFRVFIKMQDSGELDSIKAAAGRGLARRGLARPGAVRRGGSRATVLLLCGLAVAFSSASADDHSRRERREHHNWILERQEAGQVSGVPTSRRIIGNRELDVYPDGSMFEKNNYVGQAR